jgi:hemolysin D
MSVAELFRSIYGAGCDAHQFKPILAEIEESPANPLGRLFLHILFLLVAITATASYAGKLDVVVTARGKIMPVGDLKTLQPLETGAIKVIHVKEGDEVKAGQPLMEIDPAIDIAELEAKTKNLCLARLSLERIGALLRGEPFVPGGAERPELAAGQLDLYRSQRNAYDSTVRQKESEIERARQALIGLRAELSKLHALKDIAHGEEDRYLTLHRQDVVAEAAVKEKTRDKLSVERDIEVSQGQAKEAEATIRVASEELDSFRHGWREKLLAEESQLKSQEHSLAGELDALQFKQQKRFIFSPVDGYVHQLLIKTEGGVVTPAQSVLTVVPKGAKMTIWAQVQNKDVGYVGEGQKAIVKVDTFDFQKYGTAQGGVMMVSPYNVENKDARTDSYPVEVSLNTTELKDSAGNVRQLKPGMATTVEINVGTRRVYEFFLFPLMKGLDEGMKVR